MLRSRGSRAVVTTAIVVVAAPLALAAGASAQDSAASRTFTIELTLDQVVYELAESRASAVDAPPSEAPFANQPMFNLGAVRLPSDSPSFSFDDPSAEGRCGSRRCSDLAASFAVTAEDDAVNLSFGATAGVADNVSSLVPSGGKERSRWYLFVAADAQAMSWRFAGQDQDDASVKLDDMRLLGDVQAGLGGRVAGGDLAMGFVSREVSHMGASRQENFVGLTFGWDGT